MPARLLKPSQVPLASETTHQCVLPALARSVSADLGRFVVSKLLKKTSQDSLVVELLVHITL